jgi:hypothetical protein
VRCAERAFISNGISISSKNLAAFSITGRSDVLPIMILTIGFIKRKYFVYIKSVNPQCAKIAIC